MVFAQLPVTAVMAVNQKSGKSGKSITGLQQLFGRQVSSKDERELMTKKMSDEKMTIAQPRENGKVRRFQHGARVAVEC